LVLEVSEYIRSEAEAGRVRNRAAALAEEVGAGTVISGAYYLEGDSIRLHADVTDATEGRLIGSPESVVGPRSAPAELISGLRQQVMGLLAVAFDERLASTTHLMGQLPTYEAYQAFAEGMDEYSISGNMSAAQRLFYRAFELDSTFLTALIYASLTHTKIRPGELRSADSLTQVLAAHSDQLSEYDRHWLHYLEAYVHGDQEARVVALRGAARMAPQSIAVFELVDALEQTYRNHEALEVLATLDPARGVMRGNRDYWSQMIVSLRYVGEHSRQLEVLHEARRHYPDDAWLDYTEVATLLDLGRVDEAEDLVPDLPIEQLRPGFHLWIGKEFLRHGHPEVAREVFDWIIEWMRDRPPEESAQERWRQPGYWEYRLAHTLYYAEQWDEARRLFERLASELPDIVPYDPASEGDFEADYVNCVGYLGVIAARLGERERALEISGQLAAMSQPYLNGRHTEWRARIAAVLGQREDAVRLLREAYRQGAASPVRVFTHVDFNLPLRDYPPFQEFISPKG
jgi:tetratricopeptide (TPR) repeat protein